MDPELEEPRGQGTSPSVTENGAAADWQLDPSLFPNIDELVIEDGKPVDSVRIEKLLRLLMEPLYSSWSGPGENRPFKALANVGLFHTRGSLPLVPDAMLSLDVPQGTDLSIKENRSYFVWIIGKVPNVVIEIVSDRRGGEATHKLRTYARIGVPYYVIFDPENYLDETVLHAFALREGVYEPIEPRWFATVGLGLTLWEGSFEGQEGTWLRWCDHEGRVIPTGRERTEEERQRIARLEAQLRALGVDPSA